MSRNDGRKSNELRKIKVTKNYTMHAEGSCLIEFGDTRVICTATVENSVPPFLKDTGKGWVTAEYGMLPRSCTTRVRRTPISARSQEIQRLIGRSLRSVVDLEKLGERTIRVDCDVLQADGGTRTASITGGFIALALSIMKIRERNNLIEMPLTDFVAAISVGIFKDELLLDVNYEEDSNAQMDMNVVKVGNGNFVEVQGTAEGKPFTKDQMDQLLDLASQGIDDLIKIQKENLEGLDLEMLKK